MDDADFTVLAHRLARLTRRAMMAQMAGEAWAHEVGLRPGCIGVLRAVAEGGPVSQRAVSDRLTMDPSDIVTLVDILERAGLVTRERDTTDRRRYALNITLEGKLAVARLAEVAEEAGEAVLAPLTDTERAQLREMLSRVVNHHAAAATAPPPDGS